MTLMQQPEVISGQCVWADDVVNFQKGYVIVSYMGHALLTTQQVRII